LDHKEKIKIEKLEVDLQDGKVLIQLLETLYQTTLVSDRSKLVLKFVILTNLRSKVTLLQLSSEKILRDFHFLFLKGRNSKFFEFAFRKYQNCIEFYE
jgi:hypothetical protein